ncbi:hypothetical protein SDC9_95408 [bioreactor metagenome]|uniref:Uncharacterized protein n=1 Tax=bioreactor metagenome TaxID=1076179 RepID=A0A645A6G5_9ZZZZ
MPLLATPFAHIVGHPRCDILTGTRNSPDAATDETRANRSVQNILDQCLGRKHPSQLALNGVWGILLQNRKDLGDAEDTNEGGNQGDAAHQVVVAEGEARIRIDCIKTDHGREEAQEPDDPALDGSGLC